MPGKNEGEHEGFEAPKPYAHYEQVMQQRIHHFYIHESVLGPSHYIDLIHQMNISTVADTIIIHLNTCGGRLDTGIQIINAMSATDAHVICSLEGDAFSLGSLIFMAAHEFLVHDSSLMMIHHYSGGTYGKGNEQAAQLEGENRRFEELARRVYIPFLSEEELDNVLKGQDLWLTSDDIRKRLKKMVRVIEKEMKERNTKGARGKQ